MKITVVTVVKEDCLNIEKTIRSVLSQSDVKFEYFIKDGLSKDGTLKIIKDYARKNDNIKFVSDADFGIYDAMNISVKLAKGDFIWFMNSGDSFYNNNILSITNKLISSNKFDLVYGDVVVKKFNAEKLFKSENFESLPSNLPFCHQSSVVRKSFLELYPFKLDYKYSSDYDFFCTIFKNISNLSIKKVDKQIFSYVSEGGASDKNRIITSLEYIKISYKHFGRVSIRLILRFFKVISSVVYYEYFKRIT